MAQLPAVAKTKKVIRAFEKAGFVPQPRKSGSHQRLKRPGEHGSVTVKHDTMNIGLLKSCLRDADMSVEEFMRLYDC